MPSTLTAKPHSLEKQLRAIQALPLEDKRVHDTAHELKRLAESSSDQVSWVESSLLLAKHFLAQKNYANALVQLEGLVERDLAVNESTSADILYTSTSLYRQLDDIAKVLRYGTEALQLCQKQQDITKLINLT